MLPEMREPDFIIELATITLMVDGSVAGGPELPPAPLVHVPPQNAGLGVCSGKTPKGRRGGTAAQLIGFCPVSSPECHVLPHHRARSPITKLKPNKG